MVHDVKGSRFDLQVASCTCSHFLNQPRVGQRFPCAEDWEELLIDHGTMRPQMDSRFSIAVSLDQSNIQLGSRGESGWCSDVTSTHGAWRHAGVRFLLRRVDGTMWVGVSSVCNFVVCRARWSD